MISRLSIVYNLCSTPLWNECQRRVLSYLDQAQGSAFLFRDLSGGAAFRPAADLEALLNACTAKVDRFKLEISFLYESAALDAQQLLTYAKEAVKEAKYGGVRMPQTNLIWFVQDGANNRVNGECLMKAEDFSRQFVISSKRSDLTSVGQAVCWDGIPALLCCLASQEEHPFSPGAYSIGFAKLQCSEADMRAYIRHSFAEMLQSAKIKHRNEVEELRRKNPHWAEDLASELSRYLGGDFCYVPRTKASTSVSNVLPDDAELNRLLDQWAQRLQQAVVCTPFPEDFLYALEPEEWAAFTESFHMQMASNTHPTLKVGLLSPHKDMINAYNAYLEQYIAQWRRLLERFCRLWKARAQKMHEWVKELIIQRNRGAESQFADRQFIKRCEEAFAQPTQEIQILLATQEIVPDKEAVYLGPAASDQAWENLYASVEKMINIHTSQLLKSLTQANGNQIAAVCKETLDEEAQKIHACLAHEAFDPAGLQRYYFLPQKVIQPQYPPHSPDLQAAIVRATSQQYSNIEKLMLASLEDPIQKLTAFLPRSTSEVEHPQLEEKPQAEPVVETRERAAAEQSRTKGIQMYVNDEMELMFSWPAYLDTDRLSVSILDVHGRPADTLSIMRDPFIQNDSRYALPRLSNGLYTLVLRNAGEEICRCELPLRTPLMVSKTCENVQIDQEIFERHTMSISIDEVDEDLSNSLYLRLQDGQEIALQGKMKRNCFEYTFYTLQNTRFDLSTDGRSANYYHLHW